MELQAEWLRMWHVTFHLKEYIIESGLTWLYSDCFNWLGLGSDR